MSSLVARRRKGGGGDLDSRLSALAEAVELARGRLEDEDVDAAAAVVRRAGRRAGLGLETTVVALAGPTGAGKSTLFNALAGSELVAASRRRPTTSTATAAVWGEVAPALLDWLEVPLRHALDGREDVLVLLDLPDFDSVEAAHRVEVDRLVPVVDLLVWVVDPQKYADASLHERYLEPLAPHAGSMLVALNHADTLAPADRDRARADLGRLLEGEGLRGTPVLAVSAVTGEGLDALRAEIDERVARREAATRRLATDIGLAATRLAAGCEGRARGVGGAERAALNAALGEAAGVPRIVAAVQAAHRRNGALATGWPVARWVRRLRPDPLRRLHLGSEDVRTSLPGPTPVQRSGVASACRSLAASASEGLPDPWPRVIRRAAVASEDELPDRLDKAVAGADLTRADGEPRAVRAEDLSRSEGERRAARAADLARSGGARRGGRGASGAGAVAARNPRWWVLANGAQRLLALASLAGLLWLALLVALAWIRLDDVIPTPDVLDVPLPTLLLGGGVLLGLLLAALAGLLNRSGARRRARRAQKALHARIDNVAADAVIAPVTDALDVRDRLCRAAAQAAAG